MKWQVGKQARRFEDSEHGLVLVEGIKVDAGGPAREHVTAELGGVFDTVGGTESTGGAQGIVRLSVADGTAGDGRFRPLQYGIKQTHVALMRNVGGDPGVI